MTNISSSKKSKPESPSPADRQDDLIARIKTHIAKGDLAVEKSEQHYIAAGEYLKSLKEQHEGSWAEWESLLKTKIGIGKSRASELMHIGDGRKTVGDVRIATADRMRKNRRGRFSVSDGEDEAAVVGPKRPLPTARPAGESGGEYTVNLPTTTTVKRFATAGYPTKTEIAAAAGQAMPSTIGPMSPPDAGAGANMLAEARQFVKDFITLSFRWRDMGHRFKFLDAVTELSDDGQQELSEALSSACGIIAILGDAADKVACPGRLRLSRSKDRLELAERQAGAIHLLNTQVLRLQSQVAELKAAQEPPAADLPTADDTKH
jgi:hypothetical protein